MCFLIWQLMLAFFGRHCLREVFQTLHDYNLAGGLAIHTRFDGLDLISRSQVCQNYTQQTVFRFLSSVVALCMVATHIKKMKHSMLYVTVMYLRDTIIIIWHLNVSCLNICTWFINFH